MKRTELNPVYAFQQVCFFTSTWTNEATAHRLAFSGHTVLNSDALKILWVNYGQRRGKHHFPFRVITNRIISQVSGHRKHKYPAALPPNQGHETEAPRARCSCKERKRFIQMKRHKLSNVRVWGMLAVQITMTFS